MKRMTQLSGVAGRMAMLALCTAILGAVPMLAQDETQPPPPMHDGGGPGGPGGPGRGGPRGEERQVGMLTKRLNLSADQATQVKAIEDDSRKQMMALREDTSTPREQKRDKMMAIRTAGQAKIRAVLTDEQKTKFDAMEARMRERQSNRGGPGGGADGPPPPPPGV